MAGIPPIATRPFPHENYSIQTMFFPKAPSNNTFG